MGFLYNSSRFQWPFLQGPQCMDGSQWDRTSLPQPYQPYEMPFGWDPTFVEGQSIPDIEVEPLSGVRTEGAMLYDANRTALACHSMQPAPLEYIRGPDSKILDPNSWREFKPIAWPPRPPVHGLMHLTPAPTRASVCSADSHNPRPAYDSQSIWLCQTTTMPLNPDSIAEMDAALAVQFAPQRLAEARTVPLNTNISSNVHNGNHLPIELPFAAATPASTAGPYVSPPYLATSMDNRTSKKMMVSSAKGRTKTRDPTRELHDARPHICTKHRTAYRHHGDLVRHKRTTPGHTAYRGPVTCVCRREYSRRDGMYKHLKTKRCTGPPHSWL